MRLKSVWISHYKNLTDFSVNFEGDGFVDIFVGKNGSGKSNFLEALIEIFSHLYRGDRHERRTPIFSYTVSYEIDGVTTQIEWHERKWRINGKDRKSLGSPPLPSNILVYYSGQNHTVSELVGFYNRSFRNRLREANYDASPQFIGIGPDYKELLIAVLLLMNENNHARQQLCHKLNIDAVSDTFMLTVNRPYFIAENYELDPFVPEQQFWGIEGVTKDHLEKLLTCIKGEYTPGSLFDRTAKQYRVPLNVELFRAAFAGDTPDAIFRGFDNLKTLGMLGTFSAPLTLEGEIKASFGQFSDGQFQSLYIFAISELFKNVNCITLLDEPDAFLHPEWQFDFLRQILDISAEAARTNHILMSSHSASTIAAKVESRIRLFEFEHDKVQVVEREKGAIIGALSAGLITFSEQEARLNITHNLKNTTGPVLFTEGVTDEIILETAWDKLGYAGDRPFEIQSAFDCGFLGRLLRDETLYQSHAGRKFFGLFDFDDAYNQWNMNNSSDVETDIRKGLIRKRDGVEGYAILLPVPEDLTIRQQVINAETGAHYKSESRLSMELLFHDTPECADFFEIDPTRPGNCKRFKGKKTRFATRVVPSLGSKYFEAFRPIFDFILSKAS